MPSSSRSGGAVAVLLLVATTLAGCGVEAKPQEGITKPGDPAPAVRALRLYLDDDRCDLLSDRFAEAIDPDPDRGRALCKQGRLPVDALVEPGQYMVKDAELIDGNGVIRVLLKDGGIRDYTLIPGGPERFSVDDVKTTMAAEYGEPLRLQAREAPESEPVDARITVVSLRRIARNRLSPDEYVSSLDHYYLLHVRIASRSDKAQLLGSDGFQLALANGTPIATPREMYSPLGTPLSGVLEPHQENEGDLFFAVPSQAKPRMVQFVYGPQLTGTTLTWTAPKR
ncbi:MAG: hypothetical protein QM679_02650 [Patulibacter sp.]